MDKKKKKIVIIISLCVVIVIAGVGFFSSMSKWSQESFEAVVQETDIQSDGEVRLIVERTTEIYGDPLNSLCISENTKLLSSADEMITIDEFKNGHKVLVTLKSSFTEETPFYYPIVYEVMLIE